MRVAVGLEAMGDMAATGEESGSGNSILTKLDSLLGRELRMGRGR